MRTKISQKEKQEYEDWKIYLESFLRHYEELEDLSDEENLNEEDFDDDSHLTKKEVIKKKEEWHRFYGDEGNDKIEREFNNKLYGFEFAKTNENLIKYINKDYFEIKENFERYGLNEFTNDKIYEDDNGRNYVIIDIEDKKMEFKVTDFV